jgi:hypothetical protein
VEEAGKESVEERGEGGERGVGAYELAADDVVDLDERGTTSSSIHRRAWDERFAHACLYPGLLGSPG